MMFNGRAMLRFDSSVNIVFDGNSLFAKDTPTVSGVKIPDIIGALPEFAACSVANVAISGQSWANMRDNVSDVTGAWVPGKTNVLVCWETTNAVVNEGRTGVQAAADAAQYIAQRKAAQAWRVVLVTSIPRASAVGNSQVSRDARNAELVAADDVFRRTWREIGADALVDLRHQGSVFAFSDYLPTRWTAADIWTAHEPPEARIHLNGAGLRIVAEQIVTQGLRRLPA